MKAKFGMIVVEGRGKLGGHVASRNKSGSYFRTKVTPTNPRTSFQTAVRNLFALLSQEWRTLTAAQITAWNAAVANFLGTNIWGDSETKSGKTLFQKLNGNLDVLGAAHLASPPIPEGAVGPNTLSFVADNSANSLTVTYDVDPTADYEYVLEATPALSPGVSFVESEFRVIEILDAADVSPYVASASYIAKFGAIGATGQKMFIRIRAINTGTGESTTHIKASALIVA